MLSALTLALQQSEAQLARFLEKVSARSNIPKEELLQMWEHSAPEVISAPDVVVPIPEVQQEVAPAVVEPQVIEPPKVVVEPPKVVVEPPVEKPKKVVIEEDEDEAPVIPSKPSKIVEEDDDVPPPPPVQPAQKQDSGRCRHIMVSGKSKGQPCGAPARENGFCNKHKSSAPPVPSVPPVAQVSPAPSVPSVAPVPQAVPEPVVEKPMPVVEKVAEKVVIPVEKPVIEKVVENPSIEKKVKTPPKVSQAAPVEFIKLTTREEEQRIEFRVKTRDFILDNKKYPPAPVTSYKDYTLVEGTRVVLSTDKSSVLGYLDAKDNLVRVPTKDTDKVVLEYGIPFDASHISDSDIDD